AALSLKNNDRSAALFCVTEIESWIASNLPYRGVNWVSGIEIALRAISMLVVGSCINEHITTEQRVKIWQSLQVHAGWLERHPSKFSSANNHRAAEGLGLFLIGATCAQLPQAEQWKDAGWAILNEAAEELILPDGSGAEQAVAYHAFTLEMLLLGLHVAQAQKMEVPQLYIERVRKGAEYLRWLTDDGGHQPRIGDDDNGCVIGAYRRDDNYANSILGCAAALTHRGDLVPSNLKPSLRQLLFGALPEQHQGPSGVKHFRSGGMTVGRHKINGRDVLLAFDHGPLGHLSIAAHGHADALSVWLHIDDQPIFVDAGTYLYHSGGEWREHFRSTPAHNTLSFSGKSSSLTAGAFNWSRKANVSVREVDHMTDGWRVEAEHDGYMKDFEFIHRRSIDMKPATGFTITDTLVNFGSEDCDLHFLLYPGLTAKIKGNDITIKKGKKSLLRITGDTPLEPVIGLPETEDGGWYSPRFGEKQPATRIIYRGIMTPWRKSELHFTVLPE
ncbi:MAG TPA: alginate lyase family protein, partial [Alphaproteobacteria bacterium]|nr:alginate lyase family protein [Alphaproteobacteria bacterium]